MKLKTKELDEALSKLLLVAEKNMLDPMTSIVSLFVVDNKLIACATDKSNTLYFKLDCEDIDNKLSISVNITSFAKLIHSISTDTIELKVEKNVLKVKGNGNYKFPSIVDGKGNNIMIGDKRLKSKDVVAKVDSSTIKSIKSCISLSLAPNDFAVVEYKDYYVGGLNTLATNTENASIVRHGILDNKDYKVSTKTIDILAGLNEKFDLVHEGSLSSFRCDRCELLTRLELASNYPDFQADLFVAVFDKPMTFSTRVNRNELLATLGRCAIFTDGQIELDFSNKLSVSTSDSSVSEKVESSDSSDIKLTINLATFTSYLKTLNDDDIFIELEESEKLLKLSDSQIEHVLSSYS